MTDNARQADKENTERLTPAEKEASFNFKVGYPGKVYDDPLGNGPMTCVYNLDNGTSVMIQIEDY